MGDKTQTLISYTLGAMSRDLEWFSRVPIYSTWVATETSTYESRSVCGEWIEITKGSPVIVRLRDYLVTIGGEPDPFDAASIVAQIVCCEDYLYGCSCEPLVFDDGTSVVADIFADDFLKSFRKNHNIDARETNIVFPPDIVQCIGGSIYSILGMPVDSDGAFGVVETTGETTMVCRSISDAMHKGYFPDAPMSGIIRHHASLDLYLTEFSIVALPDNMDDDDIAIETIKGEIAPLPKCACEPLAVDMENDFSIMLHRSEQYQRY